MPLASAPRAPNTCRSSGKVLAALEEHVFQKMGHAGFAVAFVASTDQNGHIDGNGRGRRIGKQKESNAVGQTIFRDTFNGDDLLRLRLILSESWAGQEQQNPARRVNR